jgi:DNA-binding beta-propeller fold protein YncE
MRKLCYLFVVAVFCAVPGRGQTFEPLTLVQTIELPDVPVGPFTDHLCVDIKGHRLFTTMQAQKAVVVVDLDTGKVLRNIPVGNPHACVYRSDLDRLYVSDGDPTQPGLKIFNAHDYLLIKTIGLEKWTDSMVYDPISKYLYIVNGGVTGGLDYSLISIVNTTTAERVGDVKVSTEVLEDMSIGPSGSRLYITAEDSNKVVVVHTQKQTVLETWPITKGSTPVATAVDEAHHRLFVACRTTDLDGVIVVIDTQTGKELETLPIGGWLDYMVFDEQSGRIYAVCGVGHIYVYQQLAPDNYVLLGKTETALLAKTGLLVPELRRFFSTVPFLTWKPAKILVFQVQ